MRLAHSLVSFLSLSFFFPISHAAQEFAYRFCRFHYPPIVKVVPAGISRYFTQVTPAYTDTHSSVRTVMAIFVNRSHESTFIFTCTSSLPLQ